MDSRQDRAQVLLRVLAGSLTNAEAAQLLGLSVRQVRRLKASLARKGPAALLHGNRGRRPPHRLPDEVRARLVELATGGYAGWTQQRLCQALARRENIVISRSTLRRVLLAAGVRSPRPGRAPHWPAGMAPVSVDLAGRRIELLDLGGADFREPFYHQTVERWRQEHPTALRFQVSLESFVAAAQREPSREPDGFIFQVGRCGLLAGMLSAPDEHLVIKESPVVNALIAGLANATDEARRTEREALLQLMLPFMLRLGRSAGQRLFFNLSSWNARLADTLLRLFPRTPAVFLYRPAADSVASMLAQAPSWHYVADWPRASQARFFPSLATVPSEADLSAETFYAHVWRSIVESVLALPAQRLLVLEYNALLARPEEVLERVLIHFGIAERAAAAAAVSSETATEGDGRDLTGALRGRSLQPEQEAEVQAVVGNLERRLAARRAPVSTG